MTPIETERKFLIRMPEISLLSLIEGARVLHIEQTYLCREDGKNARVRRIDEGGETSYIKTLKQRISTLSCYEEETEIDREQYERELLRADNSKSTVIKTRYCIPFSEHIIEIDVYPFWNDRAILEIELGSEDEQFILPEFISVIKEVSEDKRYKNTNLAKEIPSDAI